MPKVALYNIEGAQVGEIELSDAVFGAPVNVPVMHEAVKVYLANQRQGTQSALTRTEVRGGGIKPWRQKGTGRARQGSIRAPQWKKGGVVFAPKPRDYSLSMNKKAKRVALKSALTSKVQDNELIVLDELTLASAKTKEMAKVLSALKVDGALIVLPGKEENVERATGNLPNVKTTLATSLNTYEVLKYKTLVMSRAAVEKVEEVYN